MASGKDGTAAGRATDRSRRRAERTKRRLMVRFGTDSLDRTAFTRNISESGLFLQTNSVYKPGTTIRVDIQFPDRTFSLWGTVAWAKRVPPQLAHLLDCGMGIRLVDPGPEFTEHFRAWKAGLGRS